MGVQHSHTKQSSSLANPSDYILSYMRGHNAKVAKHSELEIEHDGKGQPCLLGSGSFSTVGCNPSSVPCYTQKIIRRLAEFFDAPLYRQLTGTCVN